MLLITLALAVAPQVSSSSTPRTFTLPNDFGEAGTGSIEVQLGFYDRPDAQGAGNPFLDESVTVIEPIVVFDYNYSDTFGVSALLVYDNVSAASIDRLSYYPEQSGASGDWYIGADVGLRWKTSDQGSIGARAGFSAEYDYQSIHVGGDYNWERADRNGKLSVSLDAFIDTVEPIRFDGTTDPDEDRNSLATTVSWYQILNERTHGTFGATLASQSGFLATPYNFVVVDAPGPPDPPLFNGANGTRQEEVVPDSRLRYVAFGRVRRLLRPGMSAELGGRFYSDDWGITAFDIEPRWINSFKDGEHILELRYRYYTQGEADFYQREAFAVAPTGDATQDSDLGDFNSHNLGATWHWQTSAASRWTFSVDYSLRSDDLDNLYGLVGYQWSF